jgi:hypothetical protein
MGTARKLYVECRKRVVLVVLFAKGTVVCGAYRQKDLGHHSIFGR